MNVVVVLAGIVDEGRVLLGERLLADLLELFSKGVPALALLPLST
jgi:hypothetical protein